MNLQERLNKLCACQEAINWVGERTMKDAWRDCERGDWMLWAHSRLFPDKKRERILAAAKCVNLVRHLMKDERSLKAVDVAIAYGEGKATEEELKVPQKAAYAAAYAAADLGAYSAADVYAAAAAHACAVAHACAAAHACAVADAYAAVDADAHSASDAAAAAAADADVYVARAETLKRCADICRETIQIYEGD